MPMEAQALVGMSKMQKSTHGHEQFENLPFAPVGAHQCPFVPAQCPPVKRWDPLHLMMEWGNPLHDCAKRSTPLHRMAKKGEPPSLHSGHPLATHFCPPTQLRLIFSPREPQSLWTTGGNVWALGHFQCQEGSITVGTDRNGQALTGTRHAPMGAHRHEQFRSQCLWALMGVNNLKHPHPWVHTGMSTFLRSCNALAGTHWKI